MLDLHDAGDTMTQQRDEFEEVNIQDILEGLSADIAQLSKDRAIEKAKNKNLINLVTQARGFIAELSEEVEGLKGQIEAMGKLKPRTTKAKTAQAEEVISGELADEGPVQDA